MRALSEVSSSPSLPDTSMSILLDSSLVESSRAVEASFCEREPLLLPSRLSFSRGSNGPEEPSAALALPDAVAESPSAFFFLFLPAVLGVIREETSLIVSGTSPCMLLPYPANREFRSRAVRCAKVDSAYLLVSSNRRTLSIFFNRRCSARRSAASARTLSAPVKWSNLPTCLVASNSSSNVSSIPSLPSCSKRAYSSSLRIISSCSALALASRSSSSFLRFSSALRFSIAIVS